MAEPVLAGCAGEDAEQRCGDGEEDGAKIGHAVTNSVVHGRGLGSARRMRGLTVSECADRAGVSLRRWADWEAGRDWPTEIEVRQALGVSRETLMRLGAAAGEG
jgi:hypothetical protein